MSAFKTVERYVKNISKKVRADDPRLQNNVVLHCEDGSFFYIRDAFIIVVKTPGSPKGHTEEWICAISEHYGDHVFASDELTYWSTKNHHNNSYETLTLEGAYKL